MCILLWCPLISIIAFQKEGAKVEADSKNRHLRDFEFTQSFYPHLEKRLAEKVIQVKKLLDRQLGKPLIPSDKLTLMFPDIPFEEMLLDVGEELDLSFSQSQYDAMDGSLDSIIMCPIRDWATSTQRLARWLMCA